MPGEIVVSAGKPVYAMPLGILMLDCKFPRIRGDIGNAATFPFPVQYEVLFDVDFKALIHQEEPQAIERFLQAAQRLERLGVGALLSSCGLLLKYQQYLSSRLTIPVALSSVLLLPLLSHLLPRGTKTVVLCSNSRALDADDVAKHTGVAKERFVVAGLESGRRFNAMFNVQEAAATQTMDTQAIYAEIQAVCRQATDRLSEQGEKAGALLLECTNLGPYRERLKQEFGLPVYDFLSLAQLLRSGAL